MSTIWDRDYDPWAVGRAQDAARQAYLAQQASPSLEDSADPFLRAGAMRERLEKQAAQAELKKAKLRAKERNALPRSSFAVPGKRKLPIHDEDHVRAAMGRLDQTEDLTPEEKATARRRIARAARRFGIDASGFAGNGGDGKAVKSKSKKSVKAIHRLLVTPKYVTKMAGSEPLVIIKSAPNVRIVSGVLTDESVDRDNQVSDYQWAKKAADAWFREGGNIRAQHTTKPIGRATALIPKDAMRQLVLVAKIVDRKAIRFLDEGIYTGWSWGARSTPRAPIRIVKDQGAPGGRIVGGELTEVSLVDRPSNYSSRINVIPHEEAIPA